MSRVWLLKKLGVVWAVFLVALNYVAYVRISPAPLMDLRPFGYDAAAMNSYFEGIGDPELQIFLGTYQPLDFGFIAVSALGLFLLGRMMGGWVWPVLLWLPGLVFLGADVLENMTLRELFRDGEITTCLKGCNLLEAQLASLLTQVKFAALAITLLVVFSAWRKGVFR